MRKLKASWPCLAVTALAYYLLPPLISDAGTSMLALLIAIPALCFVCALISGLRGGFWWPYPIIAGALFLPAVFIFFNSSALIYAAGYAALSLAGCALGAPLRSAGKK